MDEAPSTAEIQANAFLGLREEPATFFLKASFQARNFGTDGMVSKTIWSASRPWYSSSLLSGGRVSYAFVAVAFLILSFEQRLTLITGGEVAGVGFPPRICGRVIGFVDLLVVF